jgi:hypothetical protein
MMRIVVLVYWKRRGVFIEAVSWAGRSIDDSHLA